MKSSCMRQQHADVLSFLHCEMIIGSTVSFAFLMSALRHFLATWEEIYMAGEVVHFSSLLNAAIFSSVRASRQFWRSFESCIIYNCDFDETLLERFVWKRLFHVIGALKSPPCALSHWPSISSIHHSTNGDARRETCFRSPLWIPLEVRTHNRALFKSLTLQL